MWIALDLVLSSCAPMPVQKITPGVAYKYDMGMTVDGVTRQGMLVAANKPSHSILIKAQGALDLLAVETCHREIDTENAATSDFFGIKNDREFSFTYTPSPLIETTGFCPVRINGFTQEENSQADGQSSWGYIDFEDSDTTLPAKMQCDGEKPYDSHGVTVCQAKFGTLQLITFPARVMVSPDPGCELPPMAVDGMSVLFPIKRGFCVYRFGEVVSKDKRRYHRLTTYGFEQIIIHGANK